MNSMLIQRSKRLPAWLDQPPLGHSCVRCRWRHRDRARDTARTSFINVHRVTGNGIGGTFTAGIEPHVQLARLESP